MALLHSEQVSCSLQGAPLRILLPHLLITIMDWVPSLHRMDLNFNYTTDKVSGDLDLQYWTIQVRRLLQLHGPRAQSDRHPRQQPRFPASP